MKILSRHMRQRYYLLSLITLALLNLWLPAASDAEPEARAATDESSPRNPWVPFPRVGANAKSWQEHHERLCKTMRISPPKVLFLGDSITEGWPFAGKDSWDNVFAPLNSFDSGIGGDSTQSLLWRVLNGGVEGIAPRVVVLLIGTNNLSSASADDTARGVAAVVNSLREKLPEAKILLLGILPRLKGGPLVSAKVSLTNACLAKFASPQVFYLDVGHVLFDSHGRITKVIEPDGIHPSDLGYRRLAVAIAPTLIGLLGSK